MDNCFTGFLNKIIPIAIKIKIVPYIFKELGFSFKKIYANVADITGFKRYENELNDASRIFKALKKVIYAIPVIKKLM